MSFGLFFLRPAHDPDVLTRASRKAIYVLLLAAPLVFGCEGRSKGDAQFGEPVGIEIGAHGPVPALSLAVAVTKGRDVGATVSSLAGAVYTAAASCPAFLASVAAGATTRLAFRAEGDLLHASAKMPEGDGAVCMAHALDGKPVKTDKPEALDVLVELRAEAGEASRP